MFTVFYNTGGRVSEITGLKVADVVLDGCAALRIRGKGRKERSVWRTTVTEIRRWLARTIWTGATTVSRLVGYSNEPPGCDGTAATRRAEQMKVCPQLAQREASPHIIRHSTAACTCYRPVSISRSSHFGSGTKTRQLHTCTWRPILR